MISYIKGELAETTAEEEGTIIIETGGIGYRVHVPGPVLEQLPAAGSPVKVYTYFQVREDAMTLYGFLSRDDLQIFRLLLGVGGIGPKGALAVLSVLSTDELRFAILGDDAKTIAKAPGIGLKTAKRLILELRDKISLEDAFTLTSDHSEESTAPGSETGGNEIKNEVVLALTALGYSSTEALKALQGIEITKDMDVESLLKQALKKMALL